MNQVASLTNSMMVSGESLDSAYRFATIMAGGVSTLPKHLQGNAADCMAVTMQAMAWGMNPYAVAQKTHVVSGTLGYEAQLVSAVVSSSTAIDGRFHYRYGGNWVVSGGAEKQERGVNINTGATIDPSCWAQVGATLKGESEIQWGEKLYPANQTVKNSPLWKTDPKQQASYLALKKWARLYCPAVMLGVYTTDELQDMPVERDITPGAKPQSAMRGPEPKTVDADIIANVNIETGEYITPVETLLEKISICETHEELALVKQDCAPHMGNEAAKSDLVGAYNSRLAEITPAAD